MNKNLYIISGCNGAGKTTASFTVLPDILHSVYSASSKEIKKTLRLCVSALKIKDSLNAWLIKL